MMNVLSPISTRLSLARRAAWAGSLVAIAVLAGCASKVPLNDSTTPVESRNPGAVTPPPGGAAGGGANGGVATVDLSSQNATANLARVVYFDLDSFVVKEEYRPVIEGFGKSLASNTAKGLVVEGHTDERGGSEYNLALGQKRAEAVVRALTVMGANASQLEAVSFGKERPAVQGNDEAAWAQNRRAELRER